MAKIVFEVGDVFSFPGQHGLNYGILLPDRKVVLIDTNVPRGRPCRIARVIDIPTNALPVMDLEMLPIYEVRFALQAVRIAILPD